MLPTQGLQWNGVFCAKVVGDGGEGISIYRQPRKRFKLSTCSARFLCCTSTQLSLEPTGKWHVALIHTAETLHARTSKAHEQIPVIETPCQDALSSTADGRPCRSSRAS